MDLGLGGVPAAVAGASRGLGWAVALELAREGAKLAICSRDGRAVQAAARSISAQTKSEVHPIVADVAAAEGADSFIRSAAESLGGLQILVSNAGGPPTGPASSFDDEAWKKAFELNLMSTVRMVRSALPHLHAHPWSRVLVITSSAVKQPIPQLVLSNAIRAASTGFAKTLAGEVGQMGTTVNCILPAQILTDRLRSLAGAPEDAEANHPAFAEMANRSPLGRLGSAQEFAAVAAFLCSKRASYVNGVSLQVDGGITSSLL